MAARTFKITLHRDGSMCFIPISFDPRAVFGKVRAPVKVTLNGHTYRSTIASMGGTVFIPLRKSNREAAGLQGNETLDVKLELDADERDVTPPKDFVKALKAKPPAWERWQELSYTHRREHVEAIEGAKKSETRTRRLEAAVRMIAARPAKKTPAGTSAYVALLRGINVGGNNMLPMKELAAMFGKAGCTDVQTYIQSGNVVFRADAKRAARISATIAKAITARFPMRIPIVVRSAGELRRVAENNPFLARGVDADKLHLVFLSGAPVVAAVAALDPKRSAPDEFIVRGAEIYLHCPNGFGRTKLSNAYFDAKLATISTVRNWRTVLKLLEMAGG
jgi:uncharacterized protein (DUF1697 family)